MQKYKKRIISVSQNRNIYVLSIEMNLKEFTSKVVPIRKELLIQSRRLNRDDNSAEDLVQEVMLKLWSIHDTLDNHPNVKALAMTILRNKFNDQWRHHQLETGHKMTDDQISDDINSVETNDEIELIRYIIEHLPPLQRQIMTMKEIEGYESNEITNITGCSAESLRQNLSRARRRIQQEYIRLTKTR
jgi:RNA polymerase sigma-70 factor, ECF subfamily